MVNAQGECACRRAEKEEEIQRRSRACAHEPPYLVQHFTAFHLRLVHRSLDADELHVRQHPAPRRHRGKRKVALAGGTLCSCLPGLTWYALETYCIELAAPQTCVIPNSRFPRRATQPLPRCIAQTIQLSHTENKPSNGKWSSEYLYGECSYIRAGSVSSGRPTPIPSYGYVPTPASLLNSSPSDVGSVSVLVGPPARATFRSPRCRRGAGCWRTWSSSASRWGGAG